MSIAIPSPSLLRQAATIKERVEALEQELEAVLSGGEVSAPVATGEFKPTVKAKRGRKRGQLMVL
jgi:hypothetical protein